MNKYQARLLISITFTLIAVVTGTGLSVHYGGIWYGLIGFVASSLASTIIVVAANLAAEFYDDMGGWQ